MAFWQRLVYYLLGAGMGVIMVIFMFGNRDLQCNYFPNARVLSELRGKHLTIPSAAQQQIEDLNLPDSALVMALERGEVDFDRSEARREPCNRYLIVMEEEDPPYEFRVENCDTIVEVLEVAAAKGFRN